MWIANLLQPISILFVYFCQGFTLKTSLLKSGHHFRSFVPFALELEGWGGGLRATIKKLKKKIKEMAKHFTRSKKKKIQRKTAIIWPTLINNLISGLYRVSESRLPSQYQSREFDESNKNFNTVFCLNWK